MYRFAIHLPPRCPSRTTPGLLQIREEYDILPILI